MQKNKKLIELFYQMEDYFFRSISKNYLDFTDVATAYHTGVDSDSLNFLSIHQPIENIDLVLATTAEFYTKHHSKWLVVIAQELESSNIKNSLANIGLQYAESSVAMALDLAAYQSLQLTELAVIKDVNNNLADWHLPLIEAFSSTAEICAIYAEQHEMALAQQANFKHFTVYLQDTAIATATLSIQGNLARIDDVGTLPIYQKQGYATYLLNYMLATAQKLGARHCFLEASAAGLSVYKKLGFQPLFSNHIYTAIKE